jgi:hypothetical protein
LIVPAWEAFALTIGNTQGSRQVLRSIFQLGLIDTVFVLFGLGGVASLFGFRAPVFDPVLLRALFFVGARFGFTIFAQINRFDQT